MSIPWIILSLVLCLSGQIWLSSLFKDSLRWRTNQIALDNTAIHMGREDRSTLNEILGVNRLLKVLEANHHAFHACAKIPATKAKCFLPDKALEVSIRNILNAAEKAAKAKWKLNDLRGEAQLLKLQIPTRTNLTRSPLKLERKRCVFCRMDNQLVVANRNFDTRLAAQGIPRDLQSGFDLERVKEGERKYEYFLVPDRGLK